MLCVFGQQLMLGLNC